MPRMRFGEDKNHSVYLKVWDGTGSIPHLRYNDPANKKIHIHHQQGSETTTIGGWKGRERGVLCASRLNCSDPVAAVNPSRIRTGIWSIAAGPGLDQLQEGMSDFRLLRLYESGARGMEPDWTGQPLNIERGVLMNSKEGMNDKSPDKTNAPANSTRFNDSHACR
ncbi:uncharacterized protein BO96DRAFT_436773 [Aspergillus niger CBS 101883]|uniref:uncharacterized protein n=1 Tax=Aspergillus lacticoffeatus (strain CBS 101883) TaxID=1450533 RepID=UPI000D7FA84D|nr:uncharacterized protein BO96DRAFT_436773 [Aspergillus niger CBS 101883]PYH53868.1 hypothetical protein BO96DRAFT_436773 [Aspergillus niger CBS 101883]